MFHDLGSSGVRSRTLRSRPPLNRFQEIFHAIKTNRYPNRTQLARSIEVTTKTIQRDLDYMRYQLGLPIEFDYARGGYYFTKPTTDLPLFQLTESELVSVFVAQKALEAYRGTPFEQPLRTAFQKLQAATINPGAKVSIKLGGSWLKHFVPPFRRDLTLVAPALPRQPKILMNQSFGGIFVKSCSRSCSGGKLDLRRLKQGAEPPPNFFKKEKHIAQPSFIKAAEWHGKAGLRAQLRLSLFWKPTLH